MPFDKVRPIGNPPLEMEEGLLFADKYRVERLLGVGGMGYVIEARHVELDERVAIKLLRSENVEDERLVARFAREARAAARVKSEHTARVFDVGTHPQFGPYMVMELVEGADLRALLARSGPLGAEVIADYVIQACVGLALCHSAGIVHRDIKPDNLVVTRVAGLPVVKLVDFGLSKPSVGTAAEAAALVQTQDLLGSPAYMSPEQVRGASDVDERTDVWSLGATMYELATGRPPFGAATVPEVCAQILESRPEPLRSAAPSLAPELVKIVERCMSKRREDRFPNVVELAIALAPFAPARTRASVEMLKRLIDANGRWVSDAALSSDTPGPPVEKSTTIGGLATPRAPRVTWGRVTLVGVAIALVALTAWLARRPTAPSATAGAGLDAASAPATQEPIRIGMSAPFSGTSASLGTEMRRGIAAYFAALNAQGGVDGRPLALDARDDRYDPALAMRNTVDLLDLKEKVGDPDAPDVRGPNGVVAFLGNVGTPTMVETFPTVVKNRALLFGTFTGAQKYLRDDTKSPYAFNFRASYYEETRAIVEYAFKLRAPRIRDHAHLLAFTQDDPYGDAGYAGLVAAYKALVNVTPAPPPLPHDDAIVRVRYARDDVASVTSGPASALAQTKRALCTLMRLSPACTGTAPSKEVVPVAIVMIDTYATGAAYIKALTDWISADAEREKRLDVTFLHVSFVGADALAHELVGFGTHLRAAGGPPRSYADGVFVTQVVPTYTSQAPAIVQYRADVAKLDGGDHNFTSLEGYLAARLFVAGLARAPSLEPRALVETFESMHAIDLGIGKELGFSSTDHQASHNVWGSRIDAHGGFSIVFTWTPAEGVVSE